MTPRCPSEEALSRFVAGLMGDDDSSVHERHLLECEECLERTRTLSQSDTLNQSFRSVIVRQVASEVERVSKVLARVQQSLPDDPIREMADPPHSDRESLIAGRTKIGTFQLRKRLGQGGMGVVYEAFDEALSRLVALKVLPAPAQELQARERFLREARAMAALHHDHVVKVFQVGEDDGLPFIAQELLRGEDLGERLHRDHILSIHNTIQIGMQIAEGLDAAHQSGVLHRDIKPSNIWLESGTDRVKLLDFGLAVSTTDRQSLTASGLLLGTPAYMSPEQARAEELSPRSDLFSLGCILYRMVTGRVPFEGKDTMSTLTALATQTPVTATQLNSDVPESLATLINRLLEKSPEDRPESAAAVIRALGQIQSSMTSIQPDSRRSSATGSDSRHGAHQKPISQRRGWIAVGSIASAVLLAAIIVITIRSKDGQETTITVKTPDESPGIQISVQPDNTIAQAGSSVPASTSRGWRNWPADAPNPLIAPMEAEQVRECQEAWARYLKVPVEYTNTLGMKFRLVPPGEFLFGASLEEAERVRSQPGASVDVTQLNQMLDGTVPPRRTVITLPLYVGTHEVTQAQFREMTGVNPSMSVPAQFPELKGQPLDRFPVESVDWTIASKFITRLSRKENLTPKQAYRLLSEAEWEYAARAGTTTAFPNKGGEADLATISWGQANSGGHPHEVGTLAANSLGLFDFQGNVSELTDDEFMDKLPSAGADSLIDPHGPIGPPNFPLLFKFFTWKGGSFASPPALLRSGARFQTTPFPWREFGFRVALPVDAVRPEAIALYPPTQTNAVSRARSKRELALAQLLDARVEVTVTAHGVETALNENSIRPSGAFSARSVRFFADTHFEPNLLDAIEQFPELVSMQIHDIDLDDAGLRRILSMPALRSLGLAGLPITASGLPGLSNSRLQALGLSNLSLITPSAYRDMGPLPHLTSLYGDVQFDDEGLECLKDSPALTRLTIKVNLSGDGLKHLAGCKELQLLDFAGSDFGPEGVRLIPVSPHLTEVAIHNTSASDDDVRHLATFPNIEKLALGGCRLTDAGVAALRGHPSLGSLQLTGTAVTDASIDSIATIKMLKEVWFDRTRVTLEGRQLLREAVPECIIYH